MKVIVAGGRGFGKYKLLEEKLLHYLQNNNLSEVIIVSGTAKGADLLGERFAKEHGCKVKRFVPDWDKFGKSAGYRRNVDMAKYSDFCVVFWDGESKGTKHMIDIANKYNLKLRIVRYKNDFQD